jgi:hypothetical protein
VKVGDIVIILVCVGKRVSVWVGSVVVDGVPVSVFVCVSVSVAVFVNVSVIVGNAVSVSVGVANKVSVAVGDSAYGPNILLSSSETAPVWARARPFNLAPVFKVIETKARMFPSNEVFEPRVAELPTCHHTLDGFPPVTEEPEDVSNVDSVLKIHMPEPIRFKFPLSEKLLVEQ